MLKKPHLFGLLFVMAALALFAFTAKSDNQAQIQSKKSHAEKLWKTSGHADKTAEAFIHWDEEGSIPTSCAKCHSTPGFKDFIADGSVDSAAAIGTTVECEVCHTDSERGIVRTHTAVTFPSGIKVENLGPEALCLECHQGRASKISVDSAITSANITDEDKINRSLRFVNIHYYGAAASQFGNIVKSGYEYAGKSYDARFAHVDGYNACTTCHNPHSLQINLQNCNTCHAWTIKSDKKSFWTGIKDPKDIRYYGSYVDYDGDGSIEEGTYYEIQDLKEVLYAVIQAYGRQMGSPIVYDDHTHPYFFHDTNGNGIADPEEVNSGNRYASFTARLLKATYNFQVAKKDPNAYAHGGKYIIQLLYDSIEDLNMKLTNPFDIASLQRTDEGHFDGSAAAWRNWDASREVPATCARCHSGEGLAYFLENGTNVAAGPSNGMLCLNCHTSPPGIRKAATVTFPSGEVENLGDSSNLCLVCHQGRAAKQTVDSAIASSRGPYSFINIHYYPTAAVLFGSEVHGGYEYEGKAYAGLQTYPSHNGLFDTCVECHMGTKSPRKNQKQVKALAGESSSSSADIPDHNVMKPNPADCVYCHGYDISQPHPGADPAKFEFSGIRPGSIPDFDGDGNMRESLKDEIKGLEAALYAQIQAYAANILGASIVYDSHAYPYFFNDLNGNGLADTNEVTSANRYRLFNAALLKAAYNYQLSQKEPCGFIHNAFYISQLLVDSIENLRGDIKAYTWR